LEGLDHTESTTYFLRLLQPWIRDFLHERHWDLYNTRTVGVKSISIPEILQELEHVATAPVSRGVQTPPSKVPAKSMHMEGWDIKIWNKDCVQGAACLPDACIDLLICDPPFGSCEPRFDQHAYRDDITVVDGYVAVPETYAQFSKAWLEQAYRVLQPNGSLYVVSGWCNTHLIQQALLDVGFHVIEKIIWKHRFGFDMKRQFVNSHCEIFYCSKHANAQPYFARESRFYDSDRATFGLRFHPNFRDRESVWSIKEPLHSGEKRTPGKLPDALVAKMLAYSSHVDHLVCDFFLGYGTTALVARSMGNRVCGFEIDPEAYRYIGEQLNDTERYAKAIRARKTNDRQAFEADLSRYLPDVAQH
jgi:modification methylase